MSDARNATPAETLERRIMDPCIPKSEAEHWAAREIEKQRAEIERLRAALALEESGFALKRSQVEKLRAKIDELMRSHEMCANAMRAESDRADEAWAEVEKQRAENERLREALRDIERGDHSDPMCVRTPEQRAREALEGKP